MLVNDGGTATQPRAPGHDRPFTASAGAAEHGRLSAASTAPGADIPRAEVARAPGQYCLCAAHLAPGHERPHAALRAAWHDRPRAATRAPGADVPPATPAEAPGQHRLRAVAIATVALPAGQPRPRQEDLPRVPANPRTLTHSLAHHTTTHAHALYRRATRYAQSRERDNPPLSKCWRGAGGEARLPPSPGACSGGGLGRGRRPTHPTTNQVQPAIQYRPTRGLAPPRPRASTASTPPAPHRPRVRHSRESGNPRPPVATGGP